MNADQCWDLIYRNGGYAYLESLVASAVREVTQERDRLRAELDAALQRQNNAEGIAAQESVRKDRAAGMELVARADKDDLMAELEDVADERDHLAELAREAIPVLKRYGFLDLQQRIEDAISGDDKPESEA